MDQHLFAIGVTTIVVFLAVLTHYEALGFFTTFLRRLELASRTRIFFLIFALLTAHLIEVWIIAFGDMVIDQMSNVGSFLGSKPMSMLDYAYFSVVTYSTVGYGDIIPVGPIRFLNAMESLTGLLLLAWSGSFTFLEMRLYWGEK